MAVNIAEKPPRITRLQGGDFVLTSRPDKPHNVELSAFIAETVEAATTACTSCALSQGVPYTSGRPGKLIKCTGYSNSADDKSRVALLADLAVDPTLERNDPKVILDVVNKAQPPCGLTSQALNAKFLR